MNRGHQGPCDLQSAAGRNQAVGNHTRPRFQKVSGKTGSPPRRDSSEPLTRYSSRVDARQNSRRHRGRDLSSGVPWAGASAKPLRGAGRGRAQTFVGSPCPYALSVLSTQSAKPTQRQPRPGPTAPVNSTTTPATRNPTPASETRQPTASPLHHVPGCVAPADRRILLPTSHQKNERPSPGLATKGRPYQARNR